MAQPKRKEKSPEPSPTANPAPAPAEGPWERPAGLTSKGWALLGLVIVLINVPMLHYLFFRGPPEATVTLPYSDSFTAGPGEALSKLATHYWSSGGLWRIVDGALLSPGVKNNPLWLKAKLPDDVAVEFDVRSESPEGDIKVEIFGDGSDHASGYVLIHGGWNNSISVIARRDEHGEAYSQMQMRAQRVAKAKGLGSDLVTPQLLRDTGVFRPDSRMRVERPSERGSAVEIGKTYHWRIERRGSLLRWLIDGQLFMQFDDPFPLKGERHNRFGFSSWEAQLFFDNLKIEPL